MKSLNHKEHEEHKGIFLCASTFQWFLLKNRGAVGRMQQSGIRRNAEHRQRKMKTLGTEHTEIFIPNFVPFVPLW
jgi:hypothetical protein